MKKIIITVFIITIVLTISFISYGMFSKNKIPNETGAKIVPISQEEYDPYDQMYKLLELGNTKEENFEIIPNKQKRTFKVILNAPTDKSKSEFYRWLITNNFNSIPKEKFLFEESPKN